MTWQTCVWCDKKLNGPYAFKRHCEGAHPQEYALDSAQRGVAQAADWLARRRVELEDWRALTAFLTAHPDLPPVIRSGLEETRRRVSYRYHQDPEVAENWIMALIEDEKKTLEEKSAALAELEKAQETQE